MLSIRARRTGSRSDEQRKDQQMSAATMAETSRIAPWRRALLVAGLVLAAAAAVAAVAGAGGGAELGAHDGVIHTED
jgi:hypothetical protein